jgi:hypothetical protein
MPPKMVTSCSIGCGRHIVLFAEEEIRKKFVYIKCYWEILGVGK